MIFTKIARLFSVFILAAFSAAAQNIVKTDSIIDADDIEYVQEQELVIAKGNVEIFKNDYLLKADKVIYDKAHHKVYAIGNVYILDPNGNEVNAADLEINQDLKEAIIEKFNIRMADDAIFTANKGNYYHHPEKMILEKAVYSSCPICKDDKAPQWQFAANKVIIDQKKEKVIYKHSFFEIYGKPVLYTPYFSHLTPNAKPRSGFLIPGQKYSTIYGSGIQVPYYLRISDDKDLLFSPIFTSRQGILYIAKYRQLTRYGLYTVQGSYNHKSKNSAEKGNRYYANINGKSKINEDWDFTTNLQYTGDKSYLRNFFNENQNYLTSQMDFIYNKNRHYAVLNSLYFQELRPTIQQKTVPFILPVIDYHKEFFGSDNNKYIIDNNLLGLSRKKGSETKRFSTTGIWAKTYFTKNGQQISVYRRLRGDAYNFTHKKDAIPQNYQNNNGPNNVARLIPEAEVQWQYPFIHANNSGIFIEPIANLILSPNMPTISNIINEDSQEIEISDDNLFSSNRYAGYDRVENGLRGAYGLNGYYKGSNEVVYSFIFGQSYRTKKDLNYSVDSGLRRNLSDAVGRFSIRPWKPIDIYYRFRLDPIDKIIRRNEIRADFTQNPYRFSAGFVAYNYISHTTESFSNRVIKSADLGAWYNITPEWVVGAKATQNYTSTKKFLLASGGSIGYNGACTTLLFSVNKDYTKNPLRNFKPTTTFSFDFHLKGIDK
jgi:LPS-assembly protein